MIAKIGDATLSRRFAAGDDARYPLVMSKVLPKLRTLSDNEAVVDSDQARKHARGKLADSVRQVIADKKPLAALGELDDLEMMEAATELTRKK